MGLFNKKKNKDDIQIDISKLRMNEGAIFGEAVPTNEFSKDDSFSIKGNGDTEDDRFEIEDDGFGKDPFSADDDYFDGFGNEHSYWTESLHKFKSEDEKHKEKCEELRKIRKSMAKTLGAPELVRDEPCNYEGHCSGTCPACCMEERALMDRIYELHENGVINMVYSDDIKNLQRKAEKYNDANNMIMGGLE